MYMIVFEGEVSFETSSVMFMLSVVAVNFRSIVVFSTLNEIGKHNWNDVRFIARNREGWRFVDNLCS
jgi:hypothetical protein